MPKVKRERSKLHAAAAGGSSGKPAAVPGAWQSVGGSRKGSASGSRMSDDAALKQVSEADLAGLDVDAAAGESEESKRAAMADALADLLAMGSDDDEDDDEDDDDMDGMDATVPNKGTLFKGKASKTGAAAVVAAAAAAGLSFAPSKPASAASAAPPAPSSAASAAAASDASKKLSKSDKRAARHAKLMGRLGLPGTLARDKKKNAGLSMLALGRELGAVLTPSEQNARTLEARREARLADRRDVLFLSDSADQEKLRSLQHSVEENRRRAEKAAKRAAEKQNKAEGGAPHAATTPAAYAAATPAPAPAQPSAPKGLTQAQRRRLQRNELAQFSAVLQHPSFQAAPLAALQTHLHNTAQMAKLQEEAMALEAQALGYAPPNAAKTKGKGKM